MNQRIHAAFNSRQTTASAAIAKGDFVSYDTYEDGKTYDGYVPENVWAKVIGVNGDGTLTLATYDADFKDEIDEVDPSRCRKLDHFGGMKNESTYYTAGKYNVYAGYYEFFITDKELTKPYTFCGTIDGLDEYDEVCCYNDEYNVHVDERLRDECESTYGSITGDFVDISEFYADGKATASAVKVVSAAEGCVKYVCEFDKSDWGYHHYEGRSAEERQTILHGLVLHGLNKTGGGVSASQLSDEDGKVVVTTKHGLGEGWEGRAVEYFRSNGIIMSKEGSECTAATAGANYSRVSRKVAEAYRLMDGRFYDGGKLDCETPFIELSNDRRMYEMALGNRTKSHSLAWEAFLNSVNAYLDWDDETEHVTRISSEQLKNWFSLNGKDYKEELKPLVDRIDKWRDERRKGEACVASAKKLTFRRTR